LFLLFQQSILGIRFAESAKQKFGRRLELESINLKYIRSRRNHFKITQQHMACLLGFKHASTYLKYERGEYCFKAIHLPVIAKELDCEITHLFFETHFAKTANQDHL
jgi:transcriptional regulator with XRE-family HTH domain